MLWFIYLWCHACEFFIIYHFIITNAKVTWTNDWLNAAVFGQAFPQFIRQNQFPQYEWNESILLFYCIYSVNLTKFFDSFIYYKIYYNCHKNQKMDGKFAYSRNICIPDVSKQYYAHAYWGFIGYIFPLPPVLPDPTTILPVVDWWFGGGPVNMVPTIPKNPPCGFPYAIA